MESKLTYKNYLVLVRGAGFIEVRAVSYEAMLADIEEAYFQPEVITWSERG